MASFLVVDDSPFLADKLKRMSKGVVIQWWE